MSREAEVRPRHGPNGNGAGSLHAPARFRHRPGVLTARALDAAALYDPRAERYVTLNPVARQIWDLLDSGMSAEAIADHLSAEYEVPRPQVANDVATQVEAFLRDDLIEPATLSAAGNRAHEIAPPLGPSARDNAVRSRPRALVPSVLRSGVVLTRVMWVLRTKRFEGTLAWIRTKCADIDADDATPLSDVRALEYSVAMAAAFSPARARCLEQSLTLYVLARSHGVRVRYCQGVQLYPFEAHAWIEYQGQVVNDVPEHVRHFTKFPDQLP